MAAYNRLITDESGDAQYPVTNSDVVFIQETQSDGTIKQQTLTAKLKSMETSFQDGVDTIVAKLKSLGITPDATTPAGIAAAIEKMYADRLEQGHNDVVADPGAYGLITEEEYKAYGEAQYNKGVSYADSRVNTNSASYTEGHSVGITDGIMSLNKSVTVSMPTRYGSRDGGSTKADVNVSGTADAIIANGKLYLSANASATGTAAHWVDGSLADVTTTNATTGSSNSVDLT